MYVTGYSISGHQVLVCGGYFGIWKMKTISECTCQLHKHGEKNVLNSVITTTVRTETGLNIMVGYFDLPKLCGYSFVIFYKTVKFCTLKHNSASIVIRLWNLYHQPKTNIKPNSALACNYLQPVPNFSVWINYDADVWSGTVHCQATCSFINRMPLLVFALHCGRRRYLKNWHIKAKPEILSLKDENTMQSFIFLNERWAL